MAKDKNYPAYLAGEHWQKLRAEFLEENSECQRCGLPRWIAKVAYGHDLHVHHATYTNLGEERHSDLEALCRRCHAIETFNFTKLKEPQSRRCHVCKKRHWNIFDTLCPLCEAVLVGGYVGDVFTTVVDRNSKSQKTMGQFIAKELKWQEKLSKMDSDKPVALPRHK